MTAWISGAWREEPNMRGVNDSKAKNAKKNHPTTTKQPCVAHQRKGAGIHSQDPAEKQPRQEKPWSRTHIVSSQHDQ
jgi:hypothetical protein